MHHHDYNLHAILHAKAKKKNNVLRNIANSYPPKLPYDTRLQNYTVAIIPFSYMAAIDWDYRPDYSQPQVRHVYVVI